MIAPVSRDLSLAHLSLIDSEPAAFIQLAAHAGFRLVDLRLSPATASDRSYTPQDRLRLCRALRPVLMDCGTAVWDIEIIRLNDQTLAEDHLPLLEAAALLGARRLKVVSDSDRHAFVAETLARLCELAAPLGLTVDLEYMIFSGVKSLPSALEIVRAARQPNLQVLVDALHWMRAGDGITAIEAAPPGSLGYVQLCDGRLATPAGRDELIREARTNRLPPGEGQFPLDDLLRAMPPNCCASVEVPLPPGKAPQAHADKLFQAAQILVARHASERIP